MAANYDAVLLDADGTLLDFDQAEQQAFFETCSAFGLPAGADSYARYRRINQQFWQMLERGEVTKEQLVVRRFEQFLAQAGSRQDPEAFNRAYLANLAHGHALIGGALPLLQALKGQCKLAIVTNGVAATQYPRLRQSGIFPYFDAVIVSEEAGVQKPDPAFFALALERCGCPDPARALVVGDSVSADICGANLAGIDACWFNPDGRPLPQGRWARFVVQSLEQVAAVVLGPRPVCRLLPERARYYYIDQYRSCAEALFYAAADRLGRSFAPDARRLVGAFSGGFGCGSLCGVAAAGCAVLGAVLLDDGGAHTSQALQPACAAFVQRFEKRAGGLLCAQLKPRYFDEKERCLALVLAAAEELEEVLLHYLFWLPENRARAAGGRS